MANSRTVLRKLIRTRNRLKKRAQNAKTGNEKISLYAEYKLPRNKVTFEIRKSKKHYYRNLISENVKQPAKLRKSLKQVLPQGKSSIETLELNDAGNVLNTNKGIAAHFYLFFSNVGQKLAEKFRGVKSEIENPWGTWKFIFFHGSHTRANKETAQFLGRQKSDRFRRN